MYCFTVWSRLPAFPFNIHFSINEFSAEVLLATISARLYTSPSEESELRQAVHRVFFDAYAIKIEAGEKVQIDCLVLDDGETSPKTPFLPAEESYAKRPTKLEPQVEPGVTTIDLARIKMRTAPRPSDRRYIVTYPSGDEQDVDFWRMADESYLYEVSCQLNPKATAGQIMSVREIKPDDPPFRERLASASYHRTVALWHQTQALWHRTHALSYPPGARILIPPIPPLHREPQPIPFADSHLPDVGLSFRDAQWTHEFAIDFADFVNFTFVYNMRGRRLELLRMRAKSNSYQSIKNFQIAYDDVKDRAHHVHIYTPWTVPDEAAKADQLSDDDDKNGGVVEGEESSQVHPAGQEASVAAANPVDAPMPTSVGGPSAVQEGRSTEPVLAALDEPPSQPGTIEARLGKDIGLIIMPQPHIVSPCSYTFGISYRAGFGRKDEWAWITQNHGLPRLEHLYADIQSTMGYAIVMCPISYDGIYERSTGLSLKDWYDAERQKNRTGLARIDFTIKGLEPLGPYRPDAPPASPPSPSEFCPQVNPSERSAGDSDVASPTGSSAGSKNEDDEAATSEVRDTSGVQKGMEWPAEPDSKDSITLNGPSTLDEETEPTDSEEETQATRGGFQPGTRAFDNIECAESGRYGIPKDAAGSGVTTPTSELKEGEPAAEPIELKRVDTRDYLDELQALKGNTTASTRLLRIIKEEGVAPASQLGLKLLDLAKALSLEGELGPSSVQKGDEYIASAVAQPLHKRLDQFAEMLDHIAFAVGVNVVEPDVNGNTPAMSPRVPPLVARNEDDPIGVRHADDGNDTELVIQDVPAQNNDRPLELCPGVALGEAQRALLGKLASPDRPKGAELCDLPDSTDEQLERAWRHGFSPTMIASMRDKSHTQASPKEKLDKVLSAAQRMQCMDGAASATADPAPPASTYPYSSYSYHRTPPRPSLESRASNISAYPQLPPTTNHAQQRGMAQSAAYVGLPSYFQAAFPQPYGVFSHGNALGGSYGSYSAMNSVAYDPYGQYQSWPSPAWGSTMMHLPTGHPSYSTSGTSGHGAGAALGVAPSSKTDFRPVYPDLRPLVPPGARDIHGI